MKAWEAVKEYVERDKRKGRVAGEETRFVSKRTLCQKAIRGIVALASILLIGAGAWMIRPAYGLLTVGCLLWLDLSLWGMKRR
jgi:hypothetical protein